ncbi:MAG: hypothetical protein GXP49_13105 [Deltaproteobacteria bacterium]|nr:hypothetical protein [Deltaproteobacteria bacterium]
MIWLQKLKDYLENLLRQELSIAPLPQGKMHGLPLYLSKMYAPYQMEVFGGKLILLRNLGETSSPGKIAKDIASLYRHFGINVAVVFDDLTSWERKRLIENGTPFIVPGRQLFLPMFFLDLREHFPNGPAEKPKYLSRAAQHVVLRQILLGDLEKRNMADLATLLGYSAMMMTKIRNELFALDLCEVETKGRGRYMVFPLPPEQLWPKALTKMRSPVFKTHFLIGKISGVKVAGASALAKRSLLKPDGLPTFAVWKKEFKSILKENSLVEIQSEEGADLVLEEWYYDPQKLSDDALVDQLSLYLSLRDNSDERIQIALEEMMETVPWSKE